MPGLALGEIYKFELRNRDSGQVDVKTDPFAFAMELRPATAGLISDPFAYAWWDGVWMQERARRDWLHAPLYMPVHGTGIPTGVSSATASLPPSCCHT